MFKSASCDLFEGRAREVFTALLLDAKHHIIGFHVVSSGSLREGLARPRKVFRPAIVAGAAAVIFGHNHPSGDRTLFPEDVATARRLIESRAGRFTSRKPASASQTEAPISDSRRGAFCDRPHGQSALCLLLSVKM